MKREISRPNAYYFICSTGYGSKGERLVAGIVPISSDGNYVLLISATRKVNAWVLPKGVWELDEATEQDAAKREAWEEAGIIVQISRDLGNIEEKRTTEQLTDEAPRAAYRFFEATVDRLETEWPEMKKRNRKWMSYKDAKAALNERPELLDALERCSINKHFA